MGQPIVVTEKPSSRPGVVRFETNRALTGMGHERYLRGADVWGERPPDVLARRLLEHPAVAGLQVNSNVVTVDLARGHGPEGLCQVIEDLYRFYPDQPEGDPADSEAAPEPPVAAEDSDAVEAPESLAEPVEATNEVRDDAPAPEADKAAPTAANPAADTDSEPATTTAAES